MSEGYIQLSRRYFEHSFWTEKRIFDRASAWLDLLQTAAFTPHKKMVIGHMVEIERGSLVASVRWLSGRWKWSNNKVCLFLDVLQGEGMINRETRHGCTVITLCNYGRYNTQQNTNATAGRHGGDGGATAGRQIEEGKEWKEGAGGRASASSSQTEDPPQIGYETNDEFLFRIRREFPDRDVDGEIRRIKQLADKDGTALTRGRIIAWLRKASPKFTPPPKKGPSYDTIKAPDPEGWMQWVGETYGTDCSAYKNRQKFADAPKDVQQQFAEFRSQPA